MNCLVCGHKLAIFRKLSLGDFCCQEHRALFNREQSDQGLARLMEVSSESMSIGGGNSNGGGHSGDGATRVYAQFLLEDLPANHNGADSLSHGPLSPAQVIGPAVQLRSPSPFVSAHAAVSAAPLPGETAPIGYEVTGFGMRLPSKQATVWNGGGATRLRPAGLIVPWSSGAGSRGAFSLAPLVAAAWAQSGYSKPISAHPDPVGVLRFAWPLVVGRVELPAVAAGIAPAAYAAVAAPPVPPPVQSMRVRLTIPAVARQMPQLELSMSAPARAEEAPVFGSSRSETITPEAPRKKSWLETLIQPRPRALKIPPRRRVRDLEDTFTYNEPAPTVSVSSRDAWRAMLAGWMPTAGATSGVFAVLFLFSALGIFFSAPSALSDRSHSWRLGNLRNAIRSRAVLKVEDDFRSGLNRWIGPAGWSQDWSYDGAGFLRPGKLGFLQQSMSLKNYRLEFLGQIERKSLGWVFRAKDESNYYVAKLMIAKPGPLPMVDLIHYPVTNGREGAKIRVALPFSVRNDTLYQVEMNVRGDQFRASVNGRVVDSWSDNRLLAGGVGFLSGKGEASRVRWIRVSDRDDVIGRVCSYLTARAERTSDEPGLSASYYAFLRPPGNLAGF